MIHDNILMAHELLRSYSRIHVSPRCSIQMEVQKSYDTSEWSAVESIMREINVPGKFINWIMLCICSVSYRYAINGLVTKLLKEKRELR